MLRLMQPMPSPGGTSGTRGTISGAGSLPRWVAEMAR